MTSRRFLSFVLALIFSIQIIMMATPGLAAQGVLMQRESVLAAGSPQSIDKNLNAARLEAIEEQAALEAAAGNIDLSRANSIMLSEAEYTRYLQSGGDVFGTPEDVRAILGDIPTSDGEVNLNDAAFSEVLYELLENSNGEEIVLEPEPQTPADATPADATPADATPADATPADATPADATPADATPADATPADATPADATPADVTPTVASPTMLAPSGISPSTDIGDVILTEPTFTDSAAPEIEVVAPYEYKVVVKDGSNQKLQGATVTLNLTGRGTNANKTRNLEVITDANGKATLGANNANDSLEGEWTGTLTVSKSGHQTFIDKVSIFVGGTGTTCVLPTQNGTDFYVAGVGYETSEVRFGKDTLYVTDKDDSAKKVVVSLMNPGPAVTLDVLLMSDRVLQNKELAKKSSVTLTANAITHVELTGKFAQEAVAGRDMLLRFTQGWSKTDYKLNNLSARTPAFDRPWVKDKMDFNALKSFSTGNVDSKCPAIGGLSIKFDLPKMKVDTYVALDGSAIMGMNVKVNKYKDEAWKKATSKEQSAYITSLYDTWQETVQKYVMGKQSLPEGTEVASFKVLGDLKIKVNAMGVLMGKYDRRTGYIDARGTLMMQIAGKWGITKKFVVFVVPANVGFELNGRLAGEVHFGLRFKTSGNTDTEQTAGDAGFTIKLEVKMEVFAGAGVKNIASVEARGHGEIDATFKYDKTLKTNPGVTVDANVGLKLNLSFLFYRKSIKLFEKKWQIYNNGNSLPAAELDEALSESGWEDMLNTQGSRAAALNTVDSDTISGTVTDTRFSTTDLSSAIEDNSSDMLMQSAVNMNADPHAKYLMGNWGNEVSSIVVFLGNIKDSSGNITNVIPYVGKVDDKGKILSASPITNEFGSVRGDYKVDVDLDAVVCEQSLYVITIARKAGAVASEAQVKAAASDKIVRIYAYDLKNLSPTFCKPLSITIDKQLIDPSNYYLPSICVVTNPDPNLATYKIYCAWACLAGENANGEREFNLDAYVSTDRTKPINKSVNEAINNHVVEFAISSDKNKSSVYYISQPNKDDSSASTLYYHDYRGDSTVRLTEAGNVSSLQSISINDNKEKIVTFFNNDTACYIENPESDQRIVRTFKNTLGMDFQFTADQFQYVSNGGTVKLVAMAYNSDKNTTTLYTWILDGQKNLHGPRSVVMPGKHFTFFTALCNSKGSMSAMLVDTNYEAATSEFAYFAEGDERVSSIVGFSAASRFVKVGGKVKANVTIQNDCAHFINEAVVGLFEKDEDTKPISVFPIKSMKIYPGEKYEDTVALQIPSSWKSGPHKLYVKIVDNTTKGVNPATSEGGEVTMMVEHATVSNLGGVYNDGHFANVVVRPAMGTENNTTPIDCNVALKVYGVNADGTSSSELKTYNLSCKDGAFVTQNIDLADAISANYATVRYEATCDGNTAKSTHFLYDFLFGSQTVYTSGTDLGAVNDDTKVYIKDDVHYGVDAITYDGFVKNDAGAFVHQTMTAITIFSDAPYKADPNDPIGEDTIGTAGQLTVGSNTYDIDLNGDVPVTVNLVGTPTSCTLAVGLTNEGTYDTPETIEFTPVEVLSALTCADKGVNSIYGFADLELDVEPITLGGNDYFNVTVYNNSQAEAPATLNVYNVTDDGETLIYTYEIAETIDFNSNRTATIPMSALSAPQGYDMLRFEIDAGNNSIPGNAGFNDAPTTAKLDITTGNNEYYYYNPLTAWLTLTYDGQGSISGGGNYEVGMENITIHATPVAGQQFKGWYNSMGELVSYSPDYTIASLGGDTMLNAVFTGEPSPQHYIYHDTEPDTEPESTLSAPRYEFEKPLRGTKNQDGSLSFNIDSGDMAVNTVAVNDKLISEGADYTLSLNGNVLALTLTTSFLNTLQAGEYKLLVRFSNGYYALTYFNADGSVVLIPVTAGDLPPQTADGGASELIVFLLAVLPVLYIARARRKREEQ